MDEALARWLRLREPLDVASRSETLTREVAAALPARVPIRALDLGTGTGSNIRYLAGRLPLPQQWLAVDRSGLLLEHLRARMSEWSTAERHDLQIVTREMNLHAFDPGLFDGRDLVTASALLDVVSASWLRDVAAQCRRVGALALFTITYDGRSSCEPPDPDDEHVRDLLNRHQLRDKGLGGPAAGPGAVAAAERAFAAAGFHVRRERSDWVAAPDQREFQATLIDGWAQAAVETAPERAESIARWRARRLQHVEAGRSRLTVGHEDLAALPERG